MKSSLKRLLPFALITFLVVSCSGDGDEGRELKSYVASYLNGNKNATVFGSLNVKQFLDKTGYEGNDKLKVLIGTEVDKINSVMNIDQPLYYVVEGPFSDDGSPSAVHLFMKVKNKDSLILELNNRSFDVTEKKDFAYTEDGDFVLGITDDLAIATVRSDDYVAEKVVKANLKALEKEEVVGKTMEVLSKTGDVVIGVNLENLYGTSNTDLAKLEASKRKEIETMVKDSYLVTAFKFEKGEATVTIDHLFSEALQKEMFFRNDPSTKIFSKLNKGEGIMLAGAAVNVDVAKLESFLSKYSPETIGTVSSQLGLGGGMMGFLDSDKVLSKLSDGQMGIALFGDPMQNSFGVNTFYGTTDPGKMVVSLMQESLPKGDYEYKDDGVYGNFDMSFGGGGKTKSALKLPKGCEGFGKDGLTAFLSFQGIELDEFGFEGEMKLVEIFDYATFTYGNNGGKLYIKAKEGKENILKQAMDIVLTELTANISNISI
jgi:hypothetical protein